MGRMSITNFIMLLQALFLSAFPSDASMSTINTVSLTVDIAYRIIVCFWFLLNGCPYVKTALLTVLTRITSIYNSIINRTPDDPCHGATGADQCLSGAEVESSVASFIHSMEEESLNLNYLAGNALSSNSLFVPSPSNDISHTECQKLIELHTGHNINHLELIQTFPDTSDLDTQPRPFQQSSEAFKPPQLKTDTSFAPSLGSLVTGITLLDVASLSTGKSQLVTGNLKDF